jgi:YidC/Oxa1 family membrane protein insertase
MDNVRLILVLALVFIMMLMYQAWLEDYGSKPPPAAPTSTSSPEQPTTATGSAELPSVEAELSPSTEIPFAQPTSNPKFS